MKTRQGFVSNSSSSSFVAVVHKTIFEDALKMMKDDRRRKILRGICTEKDVFGKPLVIIQEQMDTGGVSSVFGEGDDFDYEKMGLTYDELYPDDGDEFYARECIGEYEEVLRKMMKKKEYKGDILIVDDCIG